MNIELFNAILETQTIRAAAELLNTTKEHIQQELRELGVHHTRGQRYKEAVQDFLDAGQPHQYDLFKEEATYHR